MFLKTISAAVVAISLSAVSVAAAGFTYTVSGKGSGTLAGSAFTDTDFSFTLQADLANFTEVGDIQEFDPLDSFSFNIGGNTGAVSIATELGYNAVTEGIFISRTPGIDLFDFLVGDGFDLDSEFSVAGVDVFALNQFNDVATSVGLLTFNQSSDVRFSSVSNMAAVPLPAGLPLLIGAIGAFGLIRRRAR